MYWDIFYQNIVGSYNDQPNSTLCTPCAAGNYTDALHSLFCTPCEYGMYIILESKLTSYIESICTWY